MIILTAPDHGCVYTLGTDDELCYVPIYADGTVNPNKNKINGIINDLKKNKGIADTKYDQVKIYIDKFWAYTISKSRNPQINSHISKVKQNIKNARLGTDLENLEITDQKLFKDANYKSGYVEEAHKKKRKKVLYFIKNNKYI